jgi:hypothetical protein
MVIHSGLNFLSPNDPSSDEDEEHVLFDDENTHEYSVHHYLSIQQLAEDR